MLFRYTEVKMPESKKMKDAVSVSKCSSFRVALYPFLFALFAALAVLTLVFQPVRQYAMVAVVLFFASVVPVLFFLDALAFRLLIGDGKVVLKRVVSKEEVYSYTDVSWRFQNPRVNRSAILLYVRGKVLTRVLYGAKNYTALLSLRHKGSLSREEKELLRRFGNKT